MADKNIKEGDSVAWKWGGGKPGGEVVEVSKEDPIAIQSNKGNTIKKNADPENPAVHIARPGNDVVKRASELTVEEKADDKADGKSANDEKADAKKDEKSPKKKDEPKEKKATEPKGKKNAAKEDAHQENGEKKTTKAKAGDKRDHDATKDAKDDKGEQPTGKESAKKQKTDNSGDSNAEAGDQGKKPRGRPKKDGSAATQGDKKQPAKKREPKKAATETGEPRRRDRKSVV